MKRLVIVLALFALVFTGIAVQLPQQTLAGPAINSSTESDCEAWKEYKLFGFIPTWYEYLPVDYNSNTQSCDITITQTVDEKTGDVAPSHQYWLIGLAVVDILLSIAGFLAVVFVIIGAVRYIISQGEPDHIKTAQKTILNALIGLVIVLIASPVVSFIANTLVG